MVSKDSELVSTVQEIELLETWKTGDGYGVNGTVHYSLTGSLMGTVENSLDLTCTVTGTDATPVTSVDNRN